jgi:hypothetical protein
MSLLFPQSSRCDRQPTTAALSGRASRSTLTTSETEGRIDDGQGVATREFEAFYLRPFRNDANSNVEFGYLVRLRRTGKIMSSARGEWTSLPRSKVP